MITNTATRNVDSTFVGETAQFGMDLNGKAFRILFDGIYSNKIGTPIREYMSNAFDSHIAAGCPERPFRVDLPTVLNPEFRIRDFGVGMDHATVMDLYSTMFRSTKGDSNAEVGAFGLGSKSAFAYTDTFHVTSYLNGVRNVYLAVIGPDDIPTITFLPDLSGPTDEDNGFEVAIPVSIDDMEAFYAEAKAAILGFDVRPILNVDDFAIPSPIISGDGWRVLPSDGRYASEYAVRQGCVIYPVPSSNTGIESRAVNSGYKLVVDVPIGSCEVAVSREALAFDERTRNNVKAAFTAAYAALQRSLARQVEDAEKLFDAMRLRDLANSIIWGTGRDYRWKGKPVPTNLHFPNMRFSRILPRGETQVRPNPGFSLQERNFFIVDRGQKVVRKRLRLNSYKVTHNGNVWIIENPSNHELSRFIDLLGIPTDRIISIEALPDVQRQSSGRGGQGSGVKPTGVYNMRRERLDSDSVPEKVEVWLPIERGNSTSEHYGLFGYVDPRNAMNYADWGVALGVISSMHDVYLLTPKARKDYGVTDATRYDVLVREALTTHADKVYDAIHDRTVVGLSEKAEDHYGLLTTMNVLRGADSTLMKFTAHRHWHLTHILDSAKMDTAIEEGNETVEKLRKHFPLCFGLPDDAAIKEYINSRKDNYS